MKIYTEINDVLDHMFNACTTSQISEFIPEKRGFRLHGHSTTICLERAFWNVVFPPHTDYWKIYISLGMLFGAFVGAVLSKEFYLRMPRRASEWLMITIGGLLMGIGIRMAYICNVSTFFGLLPEMNMGGYLAISGILAGAWVGSLVYKKLLEG